MHIARWGNSLAVRLPAKLAEELGLKEGDEVEIRRSGDRTLEIAKCDARAAALARMAEREWKLPEDYKFDREEANER